MELHTTRLRIRPIHIDDATSIFEYRSDAITNKYQSWIPKNIQEVRAFIEKNPPKINQANTWFQFSLLEKSTQKLIGDIGVHFIDDNGKQSEIGCTLNKKFHSKGYATEALKAIIEFLFTQLNKHRIKASIDPANTNSIKLMERLGFRKEAHHIESYFFKGQWVDDIIYAMLHREWVAQEQHQQKLKDRNAL